VHLILDRAEQAVTGESVGTMFSMGTIGAISGASRDAGYRMTLGVGLAEVGTDSKMGELGKNPSKEV